MIVVLVYIHRLPNINLLPVNLVFLSSVRWYLTISRGFTCADGKSFICCCTSYYSSLGNLLR